MNDASQNSFSQTDMAVIKKLAAEFQDVLGFSDFIVNFCNKNPEILDGLIKSNDLYSTYTKNTYHDRLTKKLQSVPDEKALRPFLRLFRGREMVRIALRDLSGKADLTETMSDLSFLADTVIDKAFSFLYQKHIEKLGVPVSAEGKKQNVVVLGLGKLGARELNFSSDVDLVFAFPESGTTTGKSVTVSNEEFFTKLSQDFLKLFSDTSEHGVLFRVDLRLRPFGENGPLVLNFRAMEYYYTSQGREWERYALIKARAVAGDIEAGNRLIKQLRPFVYRRYLDYGSFEALRDMKNSIAQEVKRKGLKNNVKLGPGGIREVEFFGQVFQLIRGGVEPALQESSILKVLNILVAENHITEDVRKELTEAYIFLRTTEHRLQEFADMQTHALPDDIKDRNRLAASMGFTSQTGFIDRLESHMKQVHHHFNDILATEDSGELEGIEKKIAGIWQDIIDSQESKKTLSVSGFNDPERILILLDALRNDSGTRALSSEGRNLLDKLLPLVIKETGLSGDPEISFTRILDLIKTIERRTCYISLLLENPGVLRHLVKLSSISPWIISFLSLHPVLLDELLDARTLYSPPSRQELSSDLNRRTERIPEGDLEYQIEELCIFKQVNVLRVAAADITDSYPLMRVSDHLSDIAELVVWKVFELAWQHCVNKYGMPGFLSENDSPAKGFGIIAYGKLGGLELGYGSDLDLVFLHSASSGKTSGKLKTENSQFYARLAQRIIHILTSRTRAGSLYDIDMRLRPSGTSGVLVSHVDSFGDYQNEKAWTWEHQALVRARLIYSDKTIAKRFGEIRKKILTRKRVPSTLLDEIKSMRERMRQEHDKAKPGEFNIKQGRGGIVDIEFIVQFLVLLNANNHEELVTWSDNVRQLEMLAKTGVLDSDSALLLKDAYLAFRKKVHRLNLKEKPAIVPGEEFHDIRQNVKNTWDRFIGS